MTAEEFCGRLAFVDHDGTFEVREDPVAAGAR
jgi:hypothetical protein